VLHYNDPVAPLDGGSVTTRSSVQQTANTAGEGMEGGQVPDWSPGPGGLPPPAASGLVRANGEDAMGPQHSVCGDAPAVARSLPVGECLCSSCSLLDSQVVTCYFVATWIQR
jgi:hypothetical protein